MVAKFGEQTEFHLVSEIWVDTGEHIAIQGAGTVPDVAEEEQQPKVAWPKVNQPRGELRKTPSEP